MSGDSSPRLYILFRTAVPGTKPVTRLPFGVCAVAKWRSLLPHNINIRVEFIV
jgi:hypothetical protein